MREIELDKWYYDVQKEQFIAIMKQYPMIPFFVDGESVMESGSTYRWNPETNQIETDILEIEFSIKGWKPGDLSTTIDEGWNVNFVVFKTTFYAGIRKDQIDGLPMIYSVILRSDNTNNTNKES